MPILPAEPDLYPEDLFERLQLGADREPTWWALHCRPRQEKQLMRRLRNVGVAHYCPLVAKRNCSPRGRVRTSYVPLFPGYAFLHGGDRERLLAIGTGCVSRCLETPDRDELSHDLSQIRRLAASGAALTPEARLTRGARVRITSGPFLGLEGVIIRRERRIQFLVAVNYLRQGASILLHDCQVESIT